MKERVLVVDDEPLNLNALKRLFRNETFRLITFSSPKQALKRIGEINPAVVVSDQCMPEMAGTVFLEEVKKRQPDAVRIILTGHADLEAAISAINQGNVFRFIQKPWDDAELKAEIAAAVEYHEMISDLRTIEESGIREMVRKKERLTGIHELAIAVRHELGQSMAVIAGYSHLLQAYFEKDKLPYTYLSNIVSQIKKMEDLTARITSIAKYETVDYSGKERMIDIDKACSS